jgi:hypothetical protein
MFQLRLKRNESCSSLNRFSSRSFISPPDIAQQTKSSLNSIEQIKFIHLIIYLIYLNISYLEHLRKCLVSLINIDSNLRIDFFLLNDHLSNINNRDLFLFFLFFDK